MEGKKIATTEDIQFAVFDGGKEITEETYEEIKKFTACINLRKEYTK